MSRIPWFGLALAALLLLAAIIGLRAIQSLPADDHDVLVLRTAQEMLNRNDWVVPYFNGEPRLKKPPLSYWLTASTAALGGGTVETWHGRLPSLLAGLAMTLAIAVVGRRLYGARAALYAAAIFVSSAGYFSYVHDARPDFVYAAWCALGYLSAALALTASTRRPVALIYLMWCAYALAALTKGPQIPALLLLATGIFTFLPTAGRPGLKVLHPVGGLVLLAAITLPWWLLLHQRIAPEALEASQLSGRLLLPHLGKLLNGYYLYRPLDLVLPWLPGVLVAWTLAFAGGRWRQAATCLLGLVIVCVTVGLSFGGQQRFFYVLPVLPALCLLAGHGIETMHAHWPRLARWVWGVQALVVLAAVVYLYGTHGLVMAGAGVLLAAAAFGFVVARAAGNWTAGVVTGLVLAAGTAFAQFADSDTFWSADRRNEYELARQLRLLVPADTPLVALDMTPAVYVFEAGRSIPELRSAAELQPLLASAATDEIYVLTELDRVPLLERAFRVEAVLLMPAGAVDRAGLYRVRSKP